MNPETIKLDGITLVVSEDKGRVFVAVNKGVFAFLEVMTPEQAREIRWALQMAEDAAKLYAHEKGGVA